MKNFKQFLFINAALSFILPVNLFSQCGDVSINTVVVPVQCYVSGAYIHSQSCDIQFSNSLNNKYYDMNIQKISGALSFSSGPVFYIPDPEVEKFSYNYLTGYYLCLSSSSSMSMYFKINEVDLHPANSATLRFSYNVNIMMDITGNGRAGLIMIS